MAFIEGPGNPKPYLYLMMFFFKASLVQVRCELGPRVGPFSVFRVLVPV